MNGLRVVTQESMIFLEESRSSNKYFAETTGNASVQT